MTLSTTTITIRRSLKHNLVFEMYLGKHGLNLFVMERKVILLLF